MPTAVGHSDERTAMVKDEIILEDRLRAAADHLERIADGTESEAAMRDLAPELVELLRDAAEAYQRANEFRRELAEGFGDFQGEAASFAKCGPYPMMLARCRTRRVHSSGQPTGDRESADRWDFASRPSQMMPGV